MKEINLSCQNFNIKPQENPHKFSRAIFYYLDEKFDSDDGPGKYPGCLLFLYSMFICVSPCLLVLEYEHEKVKMLRTRIF